MTLYDMLTDVMHDQRVWIFATNAYDQNMAVFKGIVDDARSDSNVWSELMDKVDRYQCDTGILVIFVMDEYFEKRAEDVYGINRNWGNDKEHRPWRSSLEIENDLDEEFRKVIKRRQ